MWTLQVFVISRPFKSTFIHFTLLLLLFDLKTYMAVVTFSNLKCNFSSPNFGVFQTCHIKAVNRTHKYIDIYAKLYQLPLRDIKVKLRLMRYDGQSYKPFFFDVTVDACKYLKNPNNPIVEIFYNTFRKYSNLNHTCPYAHDAIVDKLWSGDLENDFTRYIAVAYGEFGIFTEWYVLNRHECTVNAYVKVQK